MLVAPDGNSRTAPVHVFGALIDVYSGSGVFTGGGFLVAQRTSGGVALVPVALDGTVGAPVNPVGDTTEFPQLAWTGVEARMTFGEFGASNATEIVSVDAMGRARKAPQALGVQGYRPACPVLAAGTDVLVLVPGFNASTGGSVASLEIVRRAADGGVASPALQFRTIQGSSSNGASYGAERTQSQGGSTGRTQGGYSLHAWPRNRRQALAASTRGMALDRGPGASSSRISSPSAHVTASPVRSRSNAIREGNESTERPSGAKPVRFVRNADRQPKWRRTRLHTSRAPRS